MTSLWDKIKNLFGQVTGSKTSDLKHFDLNKVAPRGREDQRGDRRPWRDPRSGGGGRERGRERFQGRDRGPRRYERDRSPGRSQDSSRDYGGERGRGGRPERSGGGYGRGPRRDSQGGRPWRGRGERPMGGGRSRESAAPQASIPKEERRFLVGTITHYFPKVQAAVIKVQKGAIQMNDLLYFEGEHTKFRQKVTSLQMNHQPVHVARVGEEVGIQVNEAVHEGDQVFRVDYMPSQA